MIYQYNQLFLILSTVTLTAAYSAICPPNPTSEPVYIPHETNCSEFYECGPDRIPKLQTCPEGLDFNPILRVCDYPDHAGCRNRTSTTPQSKHFESTIFTRPPGPITNPPTNATTESSSPRTTGLPTTTQTPITTTKSSVTTASPTTETITTTTAVPTSVKPETTTRTSITTTAHSSLPTSPPTTTKAPTTTSPVTAPIPTVPPVPMPTVPTVPTVPIPTAPNFPPSVRQINCKSGRCIFPSRRVVVKYEESYRPVILSENMVAWLQNNER